MRYLPLLLVMAVSACATMGASDGTISIETVSSGQAVTGADCNVSANGKQWNVRTPVSLAVGSIAGDLRVVCNKPGYRTAETIIRPSTPMSPNVGLGVGGGSGNVGVGVGLNFPILLGGGGHPSRITIELNPQ